MSEIGRPDGKIDLTLKNVTPSVRIIELQPKHGVFRYHPKYCANIHEYVDSAIVALSMTESLSTQLLNCFANPSHLTKYCSFPALFQDRFIKP